MFPSIAGTLQMPKVGSATPANMLSQQLLQMGIQYLKCKDNYDGFMWKGQIRQFLIISWRDQFDVPISQKKFERLMHAYPTYKEWRAAKRKAVSKKKRKRNR